MKPLFLPLKTEWFLKFQSGEKCWEYRAYGPRWNERTCTIGRSITISLGYTRKRIAGTIAEFKVISSDQSPDFQRCCPCHIGLVAAFRIWFNETKPIVYKGGTGKVSTLTKCGYWWITIIDESDCGMYVKVSGGKSFGKPRWVHRATVLNFSPANNHLSISRKSAMEDVPSPRK
jgi:hypothetical protein